MQSVLLCVQDGQYLDGDIQKLYLTVAVRNSMKGTLGYIKVTFCWRQSGIIDAHMQISTLPTVPYVAAHNR